MFNIVYKEVKLIYFQLLNFILLAFLIKLKPHLIDEILFFGFLFSLSPILSLIIYWLNKILSKMPIRDKVLQIGNLTYGEVIGILWIPIILNSIPITFVIVKVLINKL